MMQAGVIGAIVGGTAGFAVGLIPAIGASAVMGTSSLISDFGRKKLPNETAEQAAKRDMRKAERFAVLTFLGVEIPSTAIGAAAGAAAGIALKCLFDAVTG